MLVATDRKEKKRGKQFTYAAKGGEGGATSCRTFRHFNLKEEAYYLGGKRGGSRSALRSSPDGEERGVLQDEREKGALERLDSAQKKWSRDRGGKEGPSRRRSYAA